MMMQGTNLLLIYFLFTGYLTSPNIQGARNCHLTFFWNMYGTDIGELTVEVNGKEWARTGKLNGRTSRGVHSGGVRGRPLEK